MEITFNSAPKCNSQQTLVEFLKQYAYYFKSINPYDNHLFHLYLTEKTENENSEKPHKIMSKVKSLIEGNNKLCALMKFSIALPNGNSISMPLVLTREEVLAIYKDIPENYIGADNL